MASPRTRYLYRTVLTFGYNANFSAVKASVISDITHFAKSLLFEMKYGRDEQLRSLDIGTAPIVFVVHSMGGLVFKKAYMLGINNDEYKNIAAQVRSVVFLSTPHRGTNLAEILNRMLSVSVFGHSAKRYISELKMNSSALEDINENFRHVAPSLRIFSFYETLKTPIGGKSMTVKSMMILEKDSSILGYPGETSQPLDADHHNVCKFSHRHEQNYKSVRAVLATLISDYGQKVVDSLPKSLGVDSTLRSNFEHVEAVLSQHHTPEDDLDAALEQRSSGPCEWLLSDPAFIDWAQPTTFSQVLWLHARPGSGKSILCSFLIDHVIKSGKLCSFFFFKYGHNSKRTENYLLRSLALQIALQVSEFEMALYSLYEEGIRLEKMEARAIWQRLFVSVLFKLNIQKTLYWIIDGLDEAESIVALLDMLSAIGISRSQICVIATSRRLSIIAKAFDKLASKVPVTAVCLDQNARDYIRYYVESEMYQMHGVPAFRQQIVSKIVDRADGNFLWAHLALKEIVQCNNQEDIERAPEEIPSGMTSLYHRMETVISQMTKESDRSPARMILMWATYARRSLDIEELIEALKPEFPRILDVRFTVDNVCGNFVTVNKNNCIQLIHQTAREYLKYSFSIPFTLAPSTSHEELFSKTLSIYLDRIIRPKLRQNPLPPLYTYAATSWPYHFKHVSVDSETALTFLVNFLQGPFVLWWIQAIAQLEALSILVSTSQILSNFVRKRRKLDSGRMPLLHRLSDLELLESWVLDLLKLVGKFGSHLLQMPIAIHKYIAQYCPTNAIIIRQFGNSNVSFSVLGLKNDEWDDCLARVSVGSSHQASMLTCSGRFIAVLTSAGTIVLWDAVTFEEILTLSVEGREIKRSSFCLPFARGASSSYICVATVVIRHAETKKSCA